MIDQVLSWFGWTRAAGQAPPPLAPEPQPVLSLTIFECDEEPAEAPAAGHA